MNEHQRERFIREIEKLAHRPYWEASQKPIAGVVIQSADAIPAGPKHGPHVYVSYRDPAGKTTGYYVPEAAHAAVRNGIEAWNRIQVCLRELGLANKERLIPSKSKARRAAFSSLLSERRKEH